METQSPPVPPANLSPPVVSAWERLAATAATLPTQDASWTLAASAAFAGQPNVVTCGDSELEGVAPLVRNGGLLELAGCGPTGEPVDLLASSPEALGRLAEEVARARLPLLLERVPADSPTSAALREAFAGRARLHASEKVGFPVLALDERWSEPGGGLSSSRRSAMRRSRRKAEKQGEIEVELLSPAPAEVSDLLDLAFEIEARSWKGEAGTALLMVPRMNDFYRRFASELASRGQLRIDLLKVGGRAVAMQYGAVWDRRHWLFKIGYDAKYSFASPGQLLLAESIAAAAKAGLTHYELFGSAASWTEAWTAEVRPCERLVVLPHSPRGAIGALSLRRRGAQSRVASLVKDGQKRVTEKAMRAYVAGPELADALAEVERCAAASIETTVGYWPDFGDSPEVVAGKAREAVAELPAGTELAVKLADLGMNDAELDALLADAAERDLRLHLDALGPETASEALRTAKRLHGQAPGRIGCTLPGRWTRSATDAESLAATGIPVRVIKGEFPAPEREELDPRQGFLAIVDRLAGGKCHVEVATHDPALARSALKRLLDTGTSCELQILYGTPSAGAVGAARELGAPVRVYVPYGHGRITYRRRDLARPATLARLARDLSPLPPRRPRGT